MWTATRCALLLLAIAVVAGDAAAQGPFLPEQRGALAGVVMDARTGQPLPGATVRLRDLERGQATDAAGRFRFENVPARVYVVSAQFVGYLAAEVRAEVPPGSVVTVQIALEPSAFELADVIVSGLGERGLSGAYRPTAVVSGRELERSLETSLAETLRRVPGLHPVYNGPAATRPTIRGMGGDRVLVLEDGQRTGDLSSTGADHATAVDPLSAERIEVVRGPAGLLYGPNALGGVINVWRDDVPRGRPLRAGGTVTTTAESVNRGLGGHAMLEAPLGARFALRAEGTLRAAGDTRTPLGVLPSSDLRTAGGSLGASYVPAWGFAGVAYRGLGTRYGVPGVFNGEQIPGAHPNGVDIEIERHVARLRAAYLEPIGPVDALEVDGHFTRYLHTEIEGVGPGGQPFIGARFSQLAGGLTATLRHSHSLEAFSNAGAVGLSATVRDLRASGGFTGTRSATEYTGAAFAFEEFERDALRLQLGARIDARHVAPYSTAPITTQGREFPVRARTFADVSASAALLWQAAPGWTLGANLARAARSPAIEELYSDGPHLADYAYDIGNPALRPEVGYGLDLFVRAARPRLALEAAVFANRVGGYIYYRPTGEIDDRLRRFPVFQADQADALFAGAEGRAQVALLPGLALDATLAYTRATRLSEGDPLPAIPPLSLSADLRYETQRFSASLGYEGAAAQNRVPRPIASPVAPGETIVPERPTPGYGLLSAHLGARLPWGGGLHAVSLQGRNLTNAVWRDHLSRVKDVAPQPGRSVALVYRVQF